MSETNKAIARRFFEASDQGLDEVWDEIIDPDWIDHDPAFGPEVFEGRRPGVEGTKRFNRVFRSAFPDIRHDIQWQVAEGDLVITLFHMSGTHKGDFFGFAPTNRSFKTIGTEMFRIANGKIVERWRLGDTMGMMSQLRGEERSVAREGARR